MIGVTAGGTVLGRLVSRFSREEFKGLLFRRYNKSTSASYLGGYVVRNDCVGLLISNSAIGEKDLFVGRFNCELRRQFSTEEGLKSLNFEKISNETLESLSEYFDELIEEASHLQDADVSSGDGVLTVKFGKEYGTYVLNRQVPNQQIWLSSPKSGPKRYDFINGTWIYKHDGKSLYDLLNKEISVIAKCPVSFDKCSYGPKSKKV